MTHIFFGLHSKKRKISAKLRKLPSIHSAMKFSNRNTGATL
jgi:hypothetical protein